MGNGEKRNPTTVQLGSSSHRTYWKGCLCRQIECSIFLFPCVNQCVVVELIGWRSPSSVECRCCVCEDFVLRKCVGDQFFSFVRIVMLRVRLGRVRFVTHNRMVSNVDVKLIQVKQRRNFVISTKTRCALRIMSENRMSEKSFPR